MPTIPPTTLRLINLADLLREEVVARAGGVEPPPDPPGEPGQWTEASVRAHYAAALGPQPPLQQQPAQPQPPEADHPHLGLWVPGLAASSSSRRPGAACSTPPPAARVVAFPCAGSAEDMYSAEGTGVRRAASPLLDWCRAAGVELLAVQPPGRGARGREPALTRASALAAAAFAVLAPRLQQRASSNCPSVPWFLIGHSAGAWVAFEFARAAAAAGLPPPARAFLSAMLPPDTPLGERPWVKSAGLATPALQAECRAWGMSEAVLSPAVWPAFEPLLRADFQLFDEYDAVNDDDDVRLGCPLTVFAGNRDGRCPPSALGGWARFATPGTGGSISAGSAEALPAFELVEVEGPHLWPLDKTAKPGWLAAIVERAAAELEQKN